MAERIDREELRALIREALKEALGRADRFPPPLQGRAREGGRAKEAGTLHASPSPNPSPQGGGEPPALKRTGTLQIASGVLTESKVAEAARTHAKIQVGAAVAITPLARDKARELRIEIERLKP